MPLSEASEQIFFRLPSACIHKCDCGTPKLPLDVIVIRVAWCLRCFCRNGQNEGWKWWCSCEAPVYLLIPAVTLFASPGPLSSKRLCHLSLCCLPKPCAHKHTWLTASHWILIMVLVIFLGNYLPRLPLIVLTVKPVRGAHEPPSALFFLISRNLIRLLVVVTLARTNLDRLLFFFIPRTPSLLSLSKPTEGCHRSSWGFDTHRFTSCSTCFIRRLEEDGWVIRLI